MVKGILSFDHIQTVKSHFFHTVKNLKIKKKRKKENTMNPVLISAIGVLVAVVFTVTAMFKGMKPLLAGPICALIICIFCGVGYNQGLASEYSASFATSVRSNLLTFVSCCLLSRVMVNTRSAEVIAKNISKLIPAKHFPISLFLVCLILRLGGMSVGAYALTFAIGIYLCQEADYSEDILIACIVGCCYAAATFAPMFPSPTNALLQTALGTPSTAGMITGMVSTVVISAAILVYQEITIRRWAKKGRTFKAHHMLGKYDNNSTVKAPALIIALIPAIIVFVCYNVFGMSASLSMFLGSFACIILNWKQFPAKQWYKDVTTGCYEGITPVVALAAMAGIGGAIKVTPMYGAIQEMLAAGTINTMIACSATAGIFAGFMGSANAGIQACTDILMPSMQASIAAGEYTAAAYHRMIAVFAAPWSALPHNGAINSMMAMFDTDFKRSYLPTFICGFVIPLIGSIVITLPMTLLGIQ